MSNKLFQGMLYQMRDAVNREMGILDDKGIVIACSRVDKTGSEHKNVLEEIAYAGDALVSGNYTYRSIGSRAKIEYIVFVEGEDAGVERPLFVKAVGGFLRQGKEQVQQETADASAGIAF